MATKGYQGDSPADRATNIMDKFIRPSSGMEIVIISSIMGKIIGFSVRNIDQVRMAFFEVLFGVLMGESV